jgi:hypothetical protein
MADNTGTVPTINLESRHPCAQSAETHIEVPCLESRIEEVEEALLRLRLQNNLLAPSLSES